MQVAALGLALLATTSAAPSLEVRQRAANENRQLLDDVGRTSTKCRACPSIAWPKDGVGGSQDRIGMSFRPTFGSSGLDASLLGRTRRPVRCGERSRPKHDPLFDRHGVTVDVCTEMLLNLICDGGSREHDDDEEFL